MYEVRTHLAILMRDSYFPLIHAVWGKYWSRTNVRGFADLHLTTSANLPYFVHFFCLFTFLWTFWICEHCSSIRTRTQTSSSVVKGAIHYTIEPICTSSRIRTHIKAFGEPYATIAPYSCISKLVVRDSNLPPSRYQRDALTKWANYQCCRVSRIRTCVLFVPNEAR